MDTEDEYLEKRLAPNPMLTKGKKDKPSLRNRLQLQEAI
jgi:hypothetical protein